MDKYTYKIFEKSWEPDQNDREEARIAMARHNHGYDGEAVYVIYVNGNLTEVNGEYETPFKILGGTIEDSAQKHIAHLIAQDEAALTENN